MKSVTFDWVSGLKVLIVIIILYWIIQFVVRPYLAVRFYQLQGGKGYYGPGIWFLLQCFKNGLTKGDFFHYHVQRVKEDPSLCSTGDRELHYI